ncbi:YDG/SRA domain-containing protein [Streptomyces sp. NPDC052701]|uniref:YDG/SRA domain-containing protein n=1 Tax=Streptomyces sp. NPDC052701 TaxID=3155533 RepID=UPI00341DD982
MLQQDGVEELCAAVEALRVDHSTGLPARHQPITLLWGLGRAAAGHPRLVPWADARKELRRLLSKYGRPGSDPSPEYPFVALSRSPLWELDGVIGEVPQARGSKLRQWLTAQNPRGGLRDKVYSTMAANPAARHRVVDALLLRFFDGEDPSLLLQDCRLTDPVFDGFGAVPGVDVGQPFTDRRALAAARVHRPNQSGICGTAEQGAESIVVSGGYEDDEDYGDVIVYTGQGGRDPDTGRQIRDQELTRGNAALVTSLTTGTPVRVVRGAGGEPKYSPTTGLRYDGLFRVEDYWAEHGRSGYLVWRYRLTQLPQTAAASQPTMPAPREPEGRQAPTRATVTTQRIVRSTAVADFVKRTHDYTCQVCDIRLATPTGAYAEAAHIQPLGRPHAGPDIAANVLCLCPNHHVLFDLGMLTIGDDLTITSRAGGSHRERLREVATHQVDREYLAYHRTRHAQLPGARGRKV